MTLFTAEGIIRAIHRAHERGICSPPDVVLFSMFRWLVTQGAAGELSPEDAMDLVDGIEHVRTRPGRRWDREDTLRGLERIAAALQVGMVVTHAA